MVYGTQITIVTGANLNQLTSLGGLTLHACKEMYASTSICLGLGKIQEHASESETLPSSPLDTYEISVGLTNVFVGQRTTMQISNSYKQSTVNLACIYLNPLLSSAD